MKLFHFFPAGVILALATLTGAGCRTDYGVGSPYQPGPTAGKAIGTGVGTVAGNAAGFGVGVVQGTAAGVANTFDPSYHMVRYWRTETAADGRGSSDISSSLGSRAAGGEDGDGATSLPSPAAIRATAVR